MVTTSSTLGKQKYLDELTYESPDVVLGNIMSDYHYSLNLHDIIDPCDWLHHCNYQHLKMNDIDKKIIQSQQPMFYNAVQHRPVNRQDVIKIVKEL
ncbi:hypothetical protein [Acetilactobacillus jinshanensis]|uniref:Uncharacterized protein n=1 Tax=Acetilactobacillus jinshanensis TaxID=1720083 RepID=A0A4P6ZKQ2_9LACO|nr:hypothetical protein [Acetilactobacillus jinshanensis]QBP18326.1 hypothetical protein ELX58_04060 [Acetilactobacillus jinshanensis]URL61191.1 hypothetical protein HGK75_04125 [uncultured bacterium]